MEYGQNERKQDSVYSKRLKAGKRRTYFFDVRETKGNDYYLIITESRKRFNEDGYDRHKIFLYKEDFNKFVKGLNEAVDYIKTELMPDYDFDAFNHDNPESSNDGSSVSSSASSPVDETTSNPEPKVEEPSSDPTPTISDNIAPTSSFSEGTSDAQLSSEDVDKW